MKNVNNKEIKEAGKEESGYNGWTNYETWALYTHITNDNSLQIWWTDLAKEAKTHEVMDALKEWVTGWEDDLYEGHPLPDYANLMLKDLGSTWRINYHEVAEALKGD